MKLFLTLLFAILCAATGYGQTMKALSYDVSNSVVSAPSITFTSQVSILGVTVAPDGMLQYDGNDVLELSSSTFLSEVQFSQPAATRSNLGLPLLALTNTNAATFRSAIGLPLPALTNTSNVTTMRALAGSTNTNQPYSGLIQYADSPTGDIWEMTVSNGIILKIEMQ